MRLFTLPCLLLFNVVLVTSTSAQKISGHVLGESGRPASHVTVQVKNKSNAVVTSTDGSFSIVASKLPDTLIFSASGYEPYQVLVTEKTLKDPNFEIVLLSTRTKAAAAEVVTLGYTSSERRYDASYSRSGPRDLALSDAYVSRNFLSMTKNYSCSILYQGEKIR